ncbi:hypothetical protein BGZ95_009011 [Linnemannia exigua]|uniref:Uncharacterized protein n=1 Tax=Linnemannia exigua TaxID=604196 RepID=A0AAD4HB27_9FUNG|nr:hypothetical protein BGZ95_009011 [Linnemannia exigua]
MATPDDSHVLRQLIDQIDGELSAFNTIGAGSDQSLASFTTSQGSLASSNQTDSRQGSSLSIESQGYQDQRAHQHQQQHHYSTLQQQTRQHVASATSAIFGSSFDRPVQHQTIPPTTTTTYGSTSLIMNGSYYMGPRAPQYIPSPLASPISPGLKSALPGMDHEGEETLDFTAERSRQSTSSQGSHLAVSANMIQDQTQQQQKPSYTLTSEVTYEEEEVSIVEEPEDNQVVPTQQDFDDQIKVDVTELYDNFGQVDPATNKYSDSLSGIGGMAKIDTHIPDSPLTLKLPELSFSSNDLGSLLANDSQAPGHGAIESEADKNTRSHTFNGTATDIVDLTQTQDSNKNNDASSPAIQLTGPSPLTAPANSLKYPAAFPPRQSSPLKVGYFPPNDSARDLDRTEPTGANDEQDLEAGGPEDNSAHLQDLTRTDRKRLSLVTSGMGLAAASAAAAASRTQLDKASDSNLGKSLLDLPSWDLAPLSPPVEVKETIASATATSTTTSPMNARRGSHGQQKPQDSPSGADSQFVNDVLSPPSASLMTPTTPLTTREARILAGREALLRTSPDKQRLQREISGSSISSSIASSSEKSTVAGQDMDAAAMDSQDSARSATTKSRQSQRSVQSQSSEGGIFGAVPGRGQLVDVPPEKLVFPDLSLKPIPLKAYRVRKMTLQERNMTYAIACEEFTRARSGLDVWAVRCMMQDRPALMKDPPAIVRAVVGKQIQGQGDTFASKMSMANGRMTPTVHAGSPLTSSISSGNGLGARIKNAGKRLSMDISGGMAAVTPEPYHPSGTGSLFYKQKSTKSAVELGSWSPGLARGLSNLSATAVNSAIPPAPQGTNSRRNSSSGSLQPRSGLTASPSTGGSTFLSHQKRNSIAVVGQSNPISNSLRGRTMSDVQAGSRMSMVGKDSSVSRTNSSSSSGPQQQQQQQQNLELATSPLPYRSGGPLALISPTTTSSPPIATSSAFMERPVKRSLSSHYTRRPASMMIVPNSGQSQNQVSGTSSVLRSTSNGSLGSISSSSIGSLSSNTVSDFSKGTGDMKTSSTASSLTAGLQQQQQQQHGSTATADGPRPAYAYQPDGTAIPYADETKSKDEVYSPLTSPIMIPIGGFPIARPTVQTGSFQVNGGWSSPLSAAGGGLSRPFSYAGPPSAGLGSTSSLVTSPTTVAREQQQSQQQQHWQQQQQQQQQQQRQQSFAQGYLSPTTPDRGLAVEPVKEKPEKSHRYSTASFSSIGSFAKYQKRNSKKDRKKELQEQEQQEQLQQQQQKRSLDQRYSVAVVPLSQSPSHTNDYLTEQSLDKLSDVLPHVDRDRLSIYLQRAYGDEMVAIGLAMSDLRSGQL